MFSDGIFWLKIEDINESQHKVKLDLLAEFLSTFYDVEEAKKFRNEQLKNVQFQIRYHFEHYRKSLLVLDDVHSEEILKLFSFNIPVLVTTRDEGIINTRNFTNVQKIAIKTLSADDKDVWTMDEAIKLFNKCFETSQLETINSQFPISQNAHVHDILKDFNYIPYCIPLIFQTIETVYEDLQERLKLNHSKQDIRDDLDRNWSILRSNICKCSDFVEKWEKLSQSSIDSLPDKLKEAFLDFSIFCESVPEDVFKTFWCNQDCTELDVSNILAKLKQKSLIIKMFTNTLGKRRRTSYTVHDLTHQFFQHSSIKSLSNIEVSFFFFLYHNLVYNFSLIFFTASSQNSSTKIFTKVLRKQ